MFSVRVVRFDTPTDGPGVVVINNTEVTVYVGEDAILERAYHELSGVFEWFQPDQGEDYQQGLYYKAFYDEDPPEGMTNNEIIEAILNWVRTPAEAVPE